MLSIAASSCAKHRVTKSEENPLLEVKDDPSENDLQRESNSKSWSFCELFGSSQKVGEKKIDFSKVSQTAKNFHATSSWGLTLHLFMRGDDNFVKDWYFSFEEKNSNRIRTDIEFEVFQGALSHANAQHSCKLMRQASCDKIRRKPFAWCEEWSFRVRSAKGIEFEVLIFLRTFWIKPKSGRIKNKRRMFCLF